MEENEFLVLSLSGTSVYASNLTVNMYACFYQFFKSQEVKCDDEFNEIQIKAIENGFKLVNLKYLYLTTLIKQIIFGYINVN